MMKASKYPLRFAAPAVLLAAQGGIWHIVWTFCYYGDLRNPFYWKGRLLLAAVYCAVLFVISNFYGALRVGYYRAADTALSGMVALFFANAITWAQVCLISAAIVTPAPIAAMTAVQFAVVWLWAAAVHKAYTRTFPPYRMLLLYGDPEAARRLILKLISRSEKYRIQESVCIGGTDEGDVREICSRIPAFEAVILCAVPAGLCRKLQDFCFQKSIRLYLVPGVGDILVRGAAEINLFDTPFLLMRNRGLSDEQQAVKRIVDVTLAGLALILLSPLMLLTGLAVKLCDGGPAIYSQERLTIGGRRFTLYKFRSMAVGAEENGACFANRHDGRTTAVGRWIRRFRLDETPQLINIIKGDMSIVGPRPERPEIAEEYLAAMPEFRYRLKVKAGLTGYAQVYGNYSTDPWDKLLMDLTYIAGYSLTLDFKIMLMTARALLQTERAEGIADGNVTPRKEKSKIG